MLRTAALTFAALLLLVGPAAANQCERDLNQVNAVLAQPKKLNKGLKHMQADVGGDTLLKAVNRFVEQALEDKKEGNEKTCVTRLVAAKKILNID